MLFSLKILRSFFKENLPPPKELKEFLTLYLAEVKRIIKRGNDTLFDIEIPSNRPDLLSHLGVAREISAIFQKRLQEIIPTFKEEKEEIQKFVFAEIEKKEDVLRYLLRVIFDLKISSSPKYFQDHLKNFGIKPQNNLVDILNFVMLLTGQPLHAFDLDKIEGKTLFVRRAKKGEKIVTLDGKTYSLDEDILVIADKKGPLAIAGIKGGDRARIDSSTKRVVIESANFDRKVIRQTSRKLKIKTDASLRFEHSPSPHLAKFGLDIAMNFLQKYLGAKIAKGEIDYFFAKPRRKFIILSEEKVERVLGEKIPQRKTLRILNDLGFETKIQRKFLKVKPPILRSDISLPEDLIEEIGRIFGYHNLSSKMPSSILYVGKESPLFAFEGKLKEIFEVLGFFECQSYSFISQKEKELFGRREKFLVKVSNPPSENFSYLRPSLLFGILRAISLNQKYSKEIALFEIGKVFLKRKKILEESKVAGAFFSSKDIFFAKGKLKALFDKAQIFNFEIFPLKTPPDSFPFFEKEAFGEIMARGKKIGFFGEISKEILDFYSISGPVFAFELNLNSLFKLTFEKKFKPISPYPQIIRDLSIALPKETFASFVFQKIKRVSGKLLKDLELIDFYQGPPLPQDKKSLTFRLTFQSSKKAISSKEVDLLLEKIKRSLPKDWQIRS